MTARCNVTRTSLCARLLLTTAHEPASHGAAQPPTHRIRTPVFGGKLAKRGGNCAAPLTEMSFPPNHTTVSAPEGGKEGREKKKRGGGVGVRGGRGPDSNPNWVKSQGNPVKIWFQAATMTPARARAAEGRMPRLDPPGKHAFSAGRSRGPRLLRWLRLC